MKEKLKHIAETMIILVISNVLGNLLTGIIARKLGVDSLDELQGFSDDGFIEENFTEGI
jgi:hypothetical protein